MENTMKLNLAQQLMEAVNDNSAFAREFVSAQDAAAMQKVLAKNGFSMTLEEVNELFADGVQQINQFHNGTESDELFEDQLDCVAGGGFIRGTLRLAGSCAVAFGFGCLCGVCPAACAATNYVAVGLSVWTTAGYMKKGW